MGAQSCFVGVGVLGYDSSNSIQFRSSSRSRPAYRLSCRSSCHNPKKANFVMKFEPDQEPKLKMKQESSQDTKFSWNMLMSAYVPLVIAPSIWTSLIVNGCFYILGLVKGQSMLTTAGYNHAFVLGILLWAAMGFPGWILCVTFLLLGSKVTKIGYDIKQRENTLEKRQGRRGPENVWGAAGASAICSMMILGLPYILPLLPLNEPLAWIPYAKHMLQVAYVASISTKLADTGASEIGKAYGRTTYLITSLKQVPRGTEGAVSLEGTVAGIFGSVLMAVLALSVGLIYPREIPIIVIASFIATTSESVIGASIQESMQLSNEFVNFIMTVIGALVGGLMWMALN